MSTGLHHVGLSVANLERSIAFYREMLGMEVVSRRTFGGELYERIFGLPGATGTLASLQAGALRLELFEFASPAPKPGDPARPVCDHGITHFCVEVADIHGVYERLRAAGVAFHCPPLAFVTARATATYGRDPDGNVFELLQQGDSPPTAFIPETVS